MKKATFLKRMQKHDDSFGKLQKRINDDVNAYAEANPESTMHDLRQVEQFTDHVILVGAWVQDRINGIATLASQEGYRKSITSKIRKVLGYTY